MVDKYDFCVIGEGLPACLSALMVQARAPQSRVILNCFPDRVFRPPLVSLSPVSEQYLKSCGVDLTEIFTQGPHNRLAASRFIDWGPYCQSHVQSWSEYGGMYGAVPFHELVSACSKEFPTQPIDYYCLAKRAISSGVTVSPTENPKSIRSTLKYGYLFNRQHLKDAIIGYLKRQGAAVIDTQCTENHACLPGDQAFDAAYQGIKRNYSCGRKLVVYSSNQFDAGSRETFYHVTKGSNSTGIDYVDYVGGGRYWFRRSGLGDVGILEVMATSSSECVNLARNYWSSRNEDKADCSLNKPENLDSAGRCYSPGNEEEKNVLGLPVPCQPMIHLSDLDFVACQMIELSDYLFSDSEDLRLSVFWGDRVKSTAAKFVRFNKLLLAIKNYEPEPGTKDEPFNDPESDRLVKSYRERGILPGVECHYPLTKKEMGALLYGLIGSSRYVNPLIAGAPKKPRLFLEAIDKAIIKAL